MWRQSWPPPLLSEEPRLWRPQRSQVVTAPAVSHRRHPRWPTSRADHGSLETWPQMPTSCGERPPLPRRPALRPQSESGRRPHEAQTAKREGQIRPWGTWIHPSRTRIWAPWLPVSGNRQEPRLRPTMEETKGKRRKRRKGEGRSGWRGHCRRRQATTAANWRGGGTFWGVGGFALVPPRRRTLGPKRWPIFHYHV
jgi:hypothetical protein